MKKVKTVMVKLEERTYPIIIGRSILDEAGNIVKKLPVGSKGLIVTNPEVKFLYGKRVFESFKKAGFEIYLKIVPDGEKYKSISQLNKIYNFLLKRHFERNSFIIALGGGVIGDLAGFAAATYARGINFIQIPTTLLAQVDSSVGGKVAINHSLGKNMIGAFYQPKLVLVDLELLSSLPLEQLKNGLAEVIKYGVIWDGRLFDYLNQHTKKILHYDFDSLDHLVFRSCQIKAMVVSRDEKEKCLRTILNFGHTLGHALESLEAYTQLSHGEAVSIGMVFAGQLAQKMKLFSRKDFEKIVILLSRYGLPTRIRIKKLEKLLPFLLSDKKIKENKIRFVLPQRIGKVCVKSIPVHLIERTLQV